MNNILWDTDEGRWKGTCPRCGHKTFLEARFSMNVKGGLVAEMLYCPGGHALYIERTSDQFKLIKTYCPIDYIHKIPPWLPEDYKSTYDELLRSRDQGNKRSVVALCSILLEAHISELIKNPGEKKKTLFDRLEILKKQGLIDADQFTSGTITRITRNNVMHPKDILSDPDQEEVDRVFEEINTYLERTYRFRSSRAIEAPTKEMEEDTKVSNSE